MIRAVYALYIVNQKLVFDLLFPTTSDDLDLELLSERNFS